MPRSSLQTAALFRLFACLAVLLLPAALPHKAEAQVSNTAEFAAGLPMSAVEGAAAPVALEVTLSAAAPTGGLPLLVTISENDGDNIADAYVASDPDWNPDTGIFTVPEGMNNATIPVVIARDSGASRNTVTVTIALAPDFPSQSGWSVGGRSTHVLTITNTEALPAATVGFQMMLPAEVNEPQTGDATVMLAVVANETPSAAVVVELDVARRTTMDVSEYSIFPRILTFTPSSSRRKTVTVTIRGDEEAEPDEYLDIVLSEGMNFPDGWEIGDGYHRLTVPTNDNTVDGVLILNPDENCKTGQGTIGFQVLSARQDIRSNTPVVATMEALGGAVSQDVNLSFDVHPPFSVYPPFLSVHPEPLVFPRGQSQITVTFTPFVSGSQLIRGFRDVQGRTEIHMYNPDRCSGWVRDESNALFVIYWYDSDNEPSPVGKTAGFSASSSALTEGEGAGIVAVDLNTAAPAGGVTARVSAAGDEIIFPGGDNASNPKTAYVTIPAGKLRGFLTVQIADEEALADVKTATLTLERVLIPPGGWSVDGAASAHEVTVRGFDTGNVVGFAKETADGHVFEPSGEDSAATLTLAVKPDRDMMLSGRAVVNVSAPVSGSLAAGDYSVLPRSLTFEPSDMSPKTVTVTVFPDDDPEPDEHIAVTLSEGSPFPANWKIGDRARTVTIPANDNTARFTDTASEAREGERHTVGITLSNPAPDGLGLSGGGLIVSASPDKLAYKILSGIIDPRDRIPAGQSTGVAVFKIREDNDSDDETYILDTISVGGDYMNWGDRTGEPYRPSISHTLTVRDNDREVFFSETESVLAEGQSATLTVNLGGPASRGVFCDTRVIIPGRPPRCSESPGGDVILSLASGDSSELTVSPEMVSIPTGETTATVTVTALADRALREPDEEVSIFVSNTIPADWTIRSPHTVTIPANGNTAEFASPASTVREGEAVNLTVELSSPAPSGGLTFTVSVSDMDGDIADPDTQTFSINEGANSGTVSFTVLDDAGLEGEENFTFTLTSAGLVSNAWGGFGTQTTHTATVPANDRQKEISFAEASSEAAEGGTLTLLLTNTSPGEVQAVGGLTVTFSASGSADTGDYTLNPSSTVTFLPTETEAEITLTITADAAAEDDETLTVSITGFSDNTWNIGTGEHVTTIPANGNTAQFASAASAPVTEGETVSLAVDLSSPAPFGGLTFTVRVSGATDDFIPRERIFTVPAGETSGAANFTAADDGNAENDETFTFTLSSAGLPDTAGWGGLGTRTVHTLTVAANGNTVGFADAASTVTEGEEANLALAFVGTIPVGGITLTVTATESDGDLDADVTVSETVVLNPGDTTLDIPVISDGRPENTETVTVAITGISQTGWFIGTHAAHTVAIPANGNTAQFASPSSTVEEGGAATLTVNLSSPPPAGGLTFTVSLNATDTGNDIGAAGDSDSQTFTVNAGANFGTVNFTVAGDTFSEGEETFTFTLSSADLESNSWGGFGTRTTHTVTVPANGNTAQFASPSSTVPEGETATLTVNLSSPAPAGGLTFTVSLNATDTGNDIGAAGDSDTKTFAVNAGANSGTVSFDIFDDTVAEGEETFTFILSSADLPGIWGVLGARTTHTVTVPASDPLALVSMSGIGYEGGSVTLTFTAPAPEGGIVLEVTATDSDNDGVADVPLPPTLTLNAGERTLTIDVPEDMMSEPDEMVTLTFRRR